MKISLIAAMARHRVIARGGRLPWHMPTDLQYFKRMTLGKPVIMGRKTYEAMGKALPERQNIVVTRQVGYQATDCEVVGSLDEALILVQTAEEVMVIGGGQLYQLALAQADRMYLTFIDAEIEGDVYFPEWNPSEWQEVSCDAHLADAENPYPFRFVILERVS